MRPRALLGFAGLSSLLSLLVALVVLSSPCAGGGALRRFGPAGPEDVREALSAWPSARALVVAASGNDGLDGSPLSYPAAYPHVFTVAATLPAHAQIPTPTHSRIATALEIDRSRVHYDATADGAIWARGRDYKASFGSDGAVYVPRLGAPATKNHPLRLSPTSVSVGGSAVAFDASASASRAPSTSTSTSLRSPGAPQANDPKSHAAPHRPSLLSRSTAAATPRRGSPAG